MNKDCFKCFEGQGIEKVKQFKIELQLYLD